MRDSLAVDVAGVLVGLLVVGLLALAVLVVRRRMLQRGGGTVDCSVRGDGGSGPWRLGVARYNGETLQWYRVFSAAPRPYLVVSRRGLVVTGRRTPNRDEVAALPADAVVVTCHDRQTDRGAAVELAMSESALTGFLAWLEAAPPGNPAPHQP